MYAHTLRLLIDTQNIAHNTVAGSSPTPFYAALYLYFPEKLCRRVFGVLFSRYDCVSVCACCVAGTRAQLSVSMYLVLIMIWLFVLQKWKCNTKSDSKWSAEWDNNRFTIRHTHTCHCYLWPSRMPSISGQQTWRSNMWRPKRKTKKNTIQIHSFDLWFGLGSFNCEMEPKKKNKTEKTYRYRMCSTSW